MLYATVIIKHLQLKGFVSGGQLPSFEGAGSQRANVVAVFFRLVVAGHLRKPQRRDAAFELPKVRSCNSQSFMTKGAHNNLVLFLSNPVSLRFLKHAAQYTREILDISFQILTKCSCHRTAGPSQNIAAAASALQEWERFVCQTCSAMATLEI